MHYHKQSNGMSPDASSQTISKECHLMHYHKQYLMECHLMHDHKQSNGMPPDA